MSFNTADADKEVAAQLECDACKGGCSCGSNCQCSTTCSCPTCNNKSRKVPEENECPNCRANCQCATPANCSCGPECTCTTCKMQVPKSEQQHVATSAHTYSDPENRRHKD